jgi:WD40 repeat protein
LKEAIMKNNKKILGFICLFLLTSCAATPKIYVKAANMTMEIESTAPYILAVDYSPDGKSVISGGADGTIRLWDLFGTGKTIKFNGHTGWISDISYSPDGRTIVSVSLDGTIRFWDVATGKEIQKISGYSMIDRNQRVRYLPDGKHVLGLTVSTAKLHEVKTGKLLKEFRGNFINIAKISPDGKAILMPDKFKRGAGATEIVLKDVVTGNEIWRTIIEKFVTSFAYTPDGKQILLVSQRISKDQAINLVLLDAATGNKVKQFPGIVSTRFPLSSWVDTLALSPDGRFALTGDFGGNYKLWDIATGKMVRWLTVEEKGDATTLLNIRSDAAFSPDSRTAVIASRASVRLFDVSTGDEIVAMIAFEDGEWLVITPEGYYNSSEKGAQYLKLKFEGKDYTVDQFYDVFYRPDIVAAKLSGQDISGLISITMKDAIKTPPPLVEFTSHTSGNDQQKAKVCYQVKSTGGGIGEVRLFHNGKLVQSDGYYREVAKTSTEQTQLASLNSRSIYADMRSLNIKAKTESTLMVSKSKGDLFEDCKEIDAIAGENEVSISAFNGSNTVQSYMKTINFSSGVKSEDPHLYILSIGIDQYTDNNVNLKYAVKDAKDLEERIKIQSATLYKPQNIHYSLVTDREATKTNIVNKVNELSNTIKPQDSFILFVAGHGVLLQNQYYMLTHDYNGQVSDTNMISSNEIVEMSKKIKSLSQLFIFDTCHAGGVDTIVSGLYDARMSVLAKKMGLHIYASANDKQAAMDGYKGNGLFTYTLLDGLNNNKEADKNKDGKVTVVGLGEYSKKMTTNISKEIGHSQTPLIINFGKDSPIYKLQ